MLGPDGRVLDATPAHPRRKLLSPGRAAARRGRRALMVERRLPGIEGSTRVLAAPAGRSSRAVVVVGQSLEDRNDTLAEARARHSRSAARGRHAGVRAGLRASPRPGCARSRRCAAVRGEVSLPSDDERLPLPAAHDEIRRLGETLNEMLDRLGPLVRARAAVRRRRQPRAAHAGGGHQDRAGGSAARRGHDPQVREALVAAVEEMRPPRADGRGPADRRARRARAGCRCGASRSSSAGCSSAVARALRRSRRRARSRDLGRRRRRAVRAADELRLRQALGNLVDNALRYGAGEIVLRARRRAAGRGARGLRSGRGFAAGFAERAFERFARGDSPARATAPAWAWRSCARSPRRTAAGRGRRGRRRDRARSGSPTVRATLGVGPASCRCRLSNARILGQSGRGWARRRPPRVRPGPLAR